MTWIDLHFIRNKIKKSIKLSIKFHDARYLNLCTIINIFFIKRNTILQIFPRYFPYKYFFFIYFLLLSKGLFSSLQSKVQIIFFLLLYFCIDTFFIFQSGLFIVANNIFYAMLCIHISCILTIDYNNLVFFCISMILFFIRK